MRPDPDLRLGEAMHGLAGRLWPLHRSLTGRGNRGTLDILREGLPALEIRSVPSGTRCFDWTVPPEWDVEEAWIEGPDGDRVVDLADHTLHLVGYSTPVEATLSLEELQEHLHSLPDQPDAIPYVTSYYQERWGFCIQHSRRERLRPGSYKVRIRSSLRAGEMVYGELLLPGRSKREVLLTTYICHPSMANNELSGVCVLHALARWLSQREDRELGYRILFVPETIGAIHYISRHLQELRERTVAGFVVTCVGDERAWSFLESRGGDTLADRAARAILSRWAPGFRTYSFLERGSDERQYCAPGVDLPVASIMRSKYAEYPEYHTSLDDLDLVTPKGLAESLFVYQRLLLLLEANRTPRVRILCEPRLGPRGLYPTLSSPDVFARVQTILNFIAYCDGTRDLLAIADRIGEDPWELVPLLRRLLDEEIVEILDQESP